MITGLPLTNANYQTSVTLLKDHYAQSQHIISAHIQALLDLPKPSNKLTNLRLFFDTIETHVHCLASLGKSLDLLDTLLAPMILTKLPDDTKRNIARNHTATEWTVSELQAAIRNKIRIFETGQHFPPSSCQPANPTASFNTVLQRRPYSKKEVGKLSCVYCKGNHAAVNCELHKDIPAHIEIIKQQWLCYNCLAHHRVSHCNLKNRCRKCGNKHHDTSICSDNPSKPASSTVTITDSTPPQTVPPTSQPAQPINNGSYTTLAPNKHSKTAIATVVGAGT